MPNTYSALYVHIIFATKGRLPLIDSAWLGELHEYMAWTLRVLNTKPEVIGGVADGRVNFGWQVGYAALSASPFE